MYLKITVVDWNMGIFYIMRIFFCATVYVAFVAGKVFLDRLFH